ncbi:tRNA (adenosine(37)-N6)-dimethylallyltransferase MiaA [Campylobacter lanienae]|uniref:tRNA (adenosine(37)-N6)-dimethylallyltransferase MiaA n=1 Tax=Campylobacter lanienae TaxID=75658 RepID=UPI002A90B661|nr:tRNA (adenosine(37)-N6)-dimethylallyltransferase MiaA [Campylobacter lanienae]MDY6134752.1 tRNA (adenosine(37)-N6)-dimethylallyltransferase MiaA [Campylobacter lanienae]
MYSELAIIGTTASGKSDLAIKVAREFNAVILSLDSLCLYKEIDIASAKPNKDELELVSHFGIDLVMPDMDFCVGDFIDEYKKAKLYAQQNNSMLIITGGSGFYLKSMLSGLSPKIEPLKIKISDDELWDLVVEIDSEFCAKFSKNDKFRLHKWYQIYTQTNEIPTQWLRLNTGEPVIKNLTIYELVWDKFELIERIKTRTKNMLENGLIDEARYLFGRYDSALKPLNSIGLKEAKEYLDGKINLNELNDLITIHTTQLAKRQRTFNKSFNSIKIDARNLNLDKFITQISNSIN